jgi:anti-sigma regulatory factor (Ser/Thr protein kinase)
LHAYHGRAPGPLRLQASVEDELLTVVVIDDGVGMSPRTDSPGLGVGLAVIRRLAEDMEVVVEDGTRLLVRLRLASAA